MEKQTIGITSKETAEKLPIFFIIGRERSGTSLLWSLLDAHPEINIPSESPFILKLYGKYHRIKYWDQKTLLKFAKELHLISWKFDYWRLDEARLKEDLLKCQGKVTFQTICKVVLYNYLSIYKKNEIKVLGDKNPVYSLWIKRLLVLFPEAKYIHIIRDYRDHLNSMIKVGFLANIVPDIILKWKYSARKLYEYRNKYPNNFISIRYEDLVSNKEVTMKKITNFIGVEFHPEVFDFYKNKEQYIEQFSEEFINHFHQALLNPIDTININKWKNELSPFNTQTANTIVSKWGERYGYHQTFKKSSLKIHIWLLPRLALVHFYHLYQDILRLLPYSVASKILKIIPDLPFIYYNLFPKDKKRFSYDIIKENNPDKFTHSK